MHMIKLKQLTLTLIKVKAHNDNLYNNIADNLAKEGRDLPPLILNSSCLPNSLLTPTFYHIAPIDRNIRKFAKMLHSPFISFK